MKLKRITTIVLVLLLSIFLIVAVVINNLKLPKRDYIEINDLIMTVNENWSKGLEEALKEKRYTFQYAVLDEQENLLIENEKKCPDSLKEAIESKCTTIPIIIDENYKGSIIVSNELEESFKEVKERVMIYLLISCILASFIITTYSLYLSKRIMQPFKKLRSFAKNVAAGNLDIPLEMDEDNIFGAFTESFDIMREELLAARESEKKANDSKKELIASLSHDIKTPLSSIKAIAEVMLIKEEDQKKNRSIKNIMNKANMIEMLINNLFHSSLEELTKLKVENNEEESTLIKSIIDEADYKHLVGKYNIPECIISFDHLRLQQVIENIISNSYKYAGTKIDINGEIQDGYLKISIRDYGISLDKNEIMKIKEKFYRGKNSKGKPGYGIGLYLAQYLMDNMEGGLEFIKAEPGLQVNIYLKLA